MSESIEAQIQQEQVLKRARDEAAARETVGIKKFVNVVRWISWCGALIPFFGIILIGIGFFIAFWGSIFIGFKGDLNGALKQVLISVLGGVAAAIVWLIVNFSFLAIFG